MIGLREFILEQLNAGGKFENISNNLDDLRTLASKLNLWKLTANEFSDVEQFLDEVFSDAGIEHRFIYANDKNYLKIPVALYDSILKISKKFPNILIDDIGSKKVKIKYKGAEKDYSILETGNGSVGKISTEDQETGTVKLWNAFAQELSNNNKLDLNPKFVKEFVSEISADFDDSWINSFTQHILVISKLIESFGENPADYRIARYGKDDEFSKVGKAYSNYIQKYTSILGGRKDSWDPSDVILYNVKHSSDVISKLNSYCNGDVVANKANFISELFDTKLLVGISLKKVEVKSATFEYFNVGQHTKIGDIKSFDVIYPKKSTSKNVAVDVVGNFNLSGVTDEDGDKVGVEHKLRIYLRTFGGGIIAMDCTAIGTKSPSLGKCAKAVWANVLGLKEKQKFTIDECLDAFDNFINNNDDRTIKEKLKEIIQSAVKEGPNCFPFILIH